MVDFNNETTISRPPSEIVACIVLEKYYNYLEADEFYVKQRSQGIASPLAVLRSRLRNLFLICNPMLKRHIKLDDYTKLYETCVRIENKPTPDELLQAFITISDLLDKIRLTKLDTKPVYNATRVEESNKAQGY